MTLPLVSIIIPAFGRVSYLKDAIYSALAQDYSAIEVVVIDDNGQGTSDQLATAALLAEPAFCDVVYLINDNNLGVAASRNKAGHTAKGQYLTFLDDDDVLMPEKVSCQMQFIRDAPISLTAYEETDEALQSIKRQHQPEICSISEFLTHKVFSQATTLLIEKALFEQVGGFPEDLSYREDTLLVMSALAQVGQLHIVDKPLFKHRIHTQARLSRRHRSLEEMAHIHQRWCEVQDQLLAQTDDKTAHRVRFEREYGFFKDSRRNGARFSARYILRLLELCLQAGQFSKVFSILVKAAF
ncbi:Glycosyl transferase [Halomonadaceae bacterium LMG 33818]|uniref:glycosyltransferase family 2 protein n=1 Tax=Cernens ardua TaxID=3402176 RepID=UPI003EDC4EBF